MKTLQDYSKEWRSGRECAYQARSFKNYDPLSDDPMYFLQLPRAERTSLLDWIVQNISPRKTMNLRLSSYGLKHVYQDDTCNYVANGQFKGAMIVAGYTPNDAMALNPSYAIKKYIGKVE